MGQILDVSCKKETQKPSGPEEPGAQAGDREQKQSTEHAPCTQHPPKANIMLSIFYHNENNWEKKVVKEKKISTQNSLSSKNIF